MNVYIPVHDFISGSDIKSDTMCAITVVITCAGIENNIILKEVQNMDKFRLIQKNKCNGGSPTH